MKRRILFIVDSDPRSSHKPAEAVRIAAGVGVWEKVEITLYLRGAAVLALGEFADDLVDGENFARYLPVLAESRQAFLVQREAPSLKELGEARVKFQAIDDNELASITSTSHATVRF
jgi:hypothetical protein